MIVIYDTSALIGLFLFHHPENKKSDEIFNYLKESDAEFYMTSHSIAEIYSNVTKGQSYLDLSPRKANQLVKNVIPETFNIIDLEKGDYFKTTEFLSKRNLLVVLFTMEFLNCARYY